MAKDTVSKETVAPKRKEIFTSFVPSMMELAIWKNVPGISAHLAYLQSMGVENVVISLKAKVGESVVLTVES